MQRERKKFKAHYSNCLHCSRGNLCQEGRGLWDAFEAAKNKAKEVASRSAKYVSKKISDVKAAIKGPRIGPPPHVREFLAKHGESKITSIKVFRKPIQSYIEKIANWVTLGKWEEKKKELEYNKVFHVGMYIWLDDGASFRLEKNQTVEIASIPSPAAEEERMDVKPPPNRTLNQFIQKGEANLTPKGYWTYESSNKDPHSGCNCQKYTMANLLANGIGFGGVGKFISQDAQALVEGYPWFAKAAKLATDAAHRANIILEGEGKKRRRVGLHRPLSHRITLLS